MKLSANHPQKENMNYRVTNPTIKNPASPHQTVGSYLIEGVANEVFAVIEAEKVWKSEGYSFHPELTSAVETNETLPHHLFP